MITDPTALKELKEVVGRLATPTIVIGDQILVGFAANRARLEELLKSPLAAVSALPKLAVSAEEQAQREAVDKTALQILKQSKTVAVVGLSPDPERPSHEVARYLQVHGYRIIPVNPTVQEALGERAYPDLAAVPDKIDVVDVFRRPEHIPAIVEAAIAKGVPAIWIQEGIVNEEAAKRAREAGLLVVMDRCIFKEHSRFAQEGKL